MKHVNITLIGDRSVGKSSLVYTLIRGNTEEYDCSYVCEDERRQIRIDNDTYIIHISETVEEDDFPKYHCEQLIRDADAFIFVYDLTNRRSFDNLVQHYERVIGLVGIDSPKMKSVIICGAKSDLDETSGREWGTPLEQSWNAPLYFTSIYDRNRVEDMFMHLLNMLRINNPPSVETVSSTEKKRCHLM